MPVACECGKVATGVRALLNVLSTSRYSGTAGRTNKPFNPLLGETYELLCAEKGFRMLAEKVSLPSSPPSLTPQPYAQSDGDLQRHPLAPCHVGAWRSARHTLRA